MTSKEPFGWAAASSTLTAFISSGAATATWPVLALLTSAALAGSTPAAAAAPPTYAERMHTRALESFRQGRFPEAYGRFIDLANAGHPASARYALWMCEEGLALFGKDWDCAPHEMEDWAHMAATMSPRVARKLTGSAQPSRR